MSKDQNDEWSHLKANILDIKAIMNSSPTASAWNNIGLERIYDPLFIAETRLKRSNISEENFTLLENDFKKEKAKFINSAAYIKNSLQKAGFEAELAIKDYDSPYSISIGLNQALEKGADHEVWGDIVKILSEHERHAPAISDVITTPQEPGQRINKKLVSEWFQLDPALVPMVNKIKKVMNRESNNNSWTIPVVSRLNAQDINALYSNLKSAGFNVSFNNPKREFTITVGTALEKGLDNFVWGETLQNIAEQRKKAMAAALDSAAEILTNLKRSRVDSFDQTITNPETQNRSPNSPPQKKGAARYT